MKWLILLFFLAACTPTVPDVPADDLSVQSSSNELANYFMQRMFAEGVERNVQLDQQYDAWHYLEAFPGLEDRDFDGAQAAQGVYRMEDGQLLYDHLAPTEHTFARVVTERGMETVMQRSSERLSITINSRDDVDELVQRLLQQ